MRRIEYLPVVAVDGVEVEGVGVGSGFFSAVVVVDAGWAVCGALLTFVSCLTGCAVVCAGWAGAAPSLGCFCIKKLELR